MAYRLPLTEQRYLKSVEYFQDIISKHTAKLPAANPVGSLAFSSTTQIQVALRTRPLLLEEASAGHCSVITQCNPCTYIHEPYFKVLSNPGIKSHKIDMDFSFGPQDDNDTVYSAIAGDLIPFLENGGIETIIAYGQTGSGKTHTINGILERAIDDMLSTLAVSNIDTDSDKSSRNDLRLYVSAFEIFGNQVSDLLNERSAVQIRETPDGGIAVMGIREDSINTTEEYNNFFSLAAANRRTAATLKNDHSSRSHAVYRVRVPARKGDQDGIFMLIDLAGSERNADQKDHDAQRISEARVTNSSLMTLKECLRNRSLAMLNESGPTHIPFRTSKLTLLLKDIFDIKSTRKSRTIMIATLAPSILDASHSLNTARYALTLKVSEAPKVNKVTKVNSSGLCVRSDGVAENTVEVNEIEIPQGKLDQILQKNPRFSF